MASRDAPSARQLKGLEKIGCVLIPSGQGFPSFKNSGVSGRFKNISQQLNAQDRAGLFALLTLISWTPIGLIRLFVWFIQNFQIGPAAPPLRLLDIGLKGVLYTLYYDNPSIQSKLGWKATVTEGDNVMEQTTATPSPSKAQPTMGEMCSPDFQQAVDHAKKASNVIADFRVGERLAYVEGLRQAILERQEEIISKIQAETGKSRTDALVAEIFAVLEHLTFIEKNAEKVLADEKVKTPIALFGKKSTIYYQPLGSVLVISPWNYPFFLAIVPIVEAFVAGNSVLFKPSEFTPLKGLIESLLSQAGFHDQWVQVIYGDGEVGRQLIQQKPDRIFFTGSVATGRKIMQQAADYLIPVELELGGKDPMIVFPSANLKRAAAAACWGSFTNTGQSCTAVERLYVHHDIYDQFKAELVAIVRQVTQGTDDDGHCDIGRMTTNFQVDIVREHLQDAKAKGAQILTGTEWDGQSPFVPPTILENVPTDAKVAQEETFGPLLPLFRFHTEEEAVKEANQSPYGLGAAVFSGDQDQSERVARALQVGNVSINNVMLTEGNSYLPFGGIKHSGMGRCKGSFGLRGFCNIKSALYDKNSGKIEVNWYPATPKKYSLFSAMTQHLFRGGGINFLKFLFNALRLESYAHKMGEQRSAAGKA